MAIRQLLRTIRAKRRGSAVAVEYRPDDDGSPDPGEVVWAWIPYEDDPSQGKDRPCLVVGREGDDLALVALTSKGRDGDPDLIGVGTGGWDPRGRPSWAKLEHIYRIAPGDVRREGSALARRRFDAVVAALRRRHGQTIVTDLRAGEGGQR